jgi:hypothetical protein
MPSWAPPGDAEAVVTGSIAEHLPPGWKGTTLGIGKARPSTRLDLSQARVLALRGALTLRGSGARGIPALGDPGLLVSLLPGISAGNGHGIGLVAHYSDHELKAHHPEARIIDVTRPPLEVIAAVASCERILSSSLHGIVIADAFGLPRRWETFDRVQGRGFKFHDYSSALGLKIAPGVWMQPKAGAVDRARAALLDAFTEAFHWRQTPERWTERNAAIAAHIRPGETVIDFGAGAQSLRGMLPEGCSYLAIDIDRRTPQTLFADANAGIFPEIGTHDVLVLGGLLEHLEQPERLLAWARNVARRIIVTYETVSPKRLSVLDRRAQGWRNDLQAHELHALFAAAGWHCRRLGAWRRQTIYELTP